MTRHPGAVAGLLGTFLAGSAASPLGAQTVVRGGVVDESTRQPVAAVELVVQDRVVATTAEDGLFLIRDLSRGIHVIVFRKIGYRPVALRAVLARGDTIERVVELGRSAVELAPIEVVASKYPPGMERFAERRVRGRGTFWDAGVLRVSEHRRLAEMLTQVNGVRPIFQRDRTVAVTRRGGGGLSMSGGETACYMAVWVDGVQVFAPTALGPRRGPDGKDAVPDLDDFKIVELEAVEVYPGPATLPPELSGTGGNCGAIVLWTRRKH